MSSVSNILKKQVIESISLAQEQNLLNFGKNKSDFSVIIESPKNVDHGDYSTGVSMIISPILDENPNKIAKVLQQILQNNEKNKEIFSKIEVVGGYINFFLNLDFISEQVKNIIENNGFVAESAGKEKINLEFISVNPTGELHVGHARSAFYGDALARVLRRMNYDITTEYYINNAKKSVQIQELGKTALGDGTEYKSDYVFAKIGENQEQIEKLEIPSEAGYFLAKIIQQDTEKFLKEKAKIEFDVWRQEEDLYKEDLIESTLSELKSKKVVYERDGATWLKTKEEKDSVLIRSNGESTYFLADIAYHKDKKSRGFTKLIDIWGADHHGHISRMKSALSNFGIGLDVFLTQLVRLKGGLKLSKRKNTIVTISDMIDVVGLDGARYFYLEKSIESQMEIDLDLASQKTQKNPVYYIQYTYARVHSILEKAQGTEIDYKISGLEEDEINVLRVLLKYVDVVEDVAKDYQVHRICSYTLNLARTFNTFYQKYRVIEKDKVNKERLVIVETTAVVLKDMLNLLGISAPEKM